MEIIKKERVQKSYYEIFVANDGTEFTNADECKKYEGSAKGVLMAKLKPLIIKDISEDSLFGFGNCDDTVWVMKPSTQNDVDAIMQAFLLYNTYMTKDDQMESLEHRRKLVQRSLDENDVILVGRGYDMDNFWFVGTRNSMKEELDKLMKIEEKNNA